MPYQNSVLPGFRPDPTVCRVGATFLGRRQTNFDCRVRADVAFDPDPGEEAGIALVMDEQHHYDLGVVRREGNREAIVRLRIGDATDVRARRAVDERTTLGVDADVDRYRFRVDGETIATARTKYLSTEVAGGFLGVMVGPYAIGNGRDNATPLLVGRFQYEPTIEG